MATTLVLFDSFKKSMADGSIDLDTHTFKAALVTSAQTLTAAGQSVYANITAEVANGNGYTTGGVALTGVTWLQVTITETIDPHNAMWTINGGTIPAGVTLSRSVLAARFDSNDPDWVASGAGFAARQFLIYSDTAINKDLVGFGIMDNTPSNVTLIAGDTLVLPVSANGWFTLVQREN